MSFQTDACKHTRTHTFTIIYTYVTLIEIDINIRMYKKSFTKNIRKFQNVYEIVDLHLQKYTHMHSHICTRTRIFMMQIKYVCTCKLFYTLEFQSR